MRGSLCLGGKLVLGTAGFPQLHSEFTIFRCDFIVALVQLSKVSLICPPTFESSFFGIHRRLNLKDVDFLLVNFLEQPNLGFKAGNELGQNGFHVNSVVYVLGVCVHLEKYHGIYKKSSDPSRAELEPTL